MFDDVQPYCPAHKICRAQGNFKEQTCKLSNNTERRMTFQCAAGMMILLDKILHASEKK